MMNKVKRIGVLRITLLSTLILLVIALIGTSIAYAYWSRTREQTNANIVKTGCFSFTMVENTASINLPLTYPMTESEAMANVTPYTFTVTNNCSMDMYYNITLNTSGNSDLDNSMKFKLVDNSNNTTTGPAIVGNQPTYSDYHNYTYTDNNGTYNIIDSYILKTGKLGHATMNNDNTQVVTAGGTKQYSLYLWLDENVTASTTMGKTFTGKIIVTGTTKTSTALYKCRRATRLHSDTCASADGVGCKGEGMTDETQITYGNLGTVGSVPVTGDAFDCDVNGDGMYSSQNERFYYVSNAWRNGSFDTSTAVLIADKKFDGTTSSVVTSAYDANGANTSGPVTATSQLPTTVQWPNVSLILGTTRNIYNDANTVVMSNFDYSGKAARLITYQEIEQGCYDGTTAITSANGLSAKCKFLLENSKYSSSTSTSYGPWLESAVNSFTDRAWRVNSDNYNLNSHYTTFAMQDVRPAIEVSLSEISY